MKFILNDGKEEHAFEIPPGITVLGRSSSCDVTLKSRRTSRRHLECHCEGNQVRVRDLGSANGTYINGMRLTQATTLKDGDKIAIGNISLRFDAADDGQPGAPMADAAAAFAADSSGGEAQATESPEGEYSENEATPQDGTFMPEVYSPQGSPQPMVTQRDGRWFLHDPRTRQEIEIVPKAPPAATAEKTKKLVTYGIIGAAALLAVILITSALFSNPTTRLEVAPHKYTKSQYNKMLGKAIAEFGKASEGGKIDADKLRHALAALDAADADWPKIKVASLLRTYFEAVAKAGRNMVDLDYETVVTLLEELERLGPTTKIVAYARSQLTKVEQMQRDLRIIGQTHNYEINGDFVKAFEKISTLSADSPVRRQNEEYIRRLQDNCRLSFVAEAELAMAEGKWDEAIEHYNKALNYAPSVPHKNEIIEKRNQCVAGKADETTLADARAKFDAGDFADAIAVVQEIAADSFYATDAIALKRKVQEVRDRNEVLSLYKSGQAQRAIDLIREKDLKAMVGLADKARAVLKAFKQAEEAEDKSGSYTEAMAAYKVVVDLEPDLDNHYHKLARERYNRFLNDKRGRAQEHLLKARAALEKEDIRAARRFAKRAMQIDGLSGAGLLEMFDKKARELCISGRVKKARGENEEARKLLEESMRYAEPGSRYFNEAQEMLHSLK